MTWAERKRANWGNTMTDFTYKGFEIQVIDVGGIAVFENPEDLGAVKHGEHRGVRPASMWQWEQFERLFCHQQVATVAFYQQDFGTEYLKPTRLMLGNFEARHDSFCQGPPHFDDQGFYEGPLQQRESATRLVGTSGAGFATTGTEQWPSEMCRWIAVSILRQFVAETCSSSCPRWRRGCNTKTLGQDGGLNTIGEVRVPPSSSPMAQKRLEEGANHDNVNHLGKNGSFTMVQGCHPWAGGMWNHEFGARILFGQNCVGRQ